MNHDTSVIQQLNYDTSRLVVVGGARSPHAVLWVSLLHLFVPPLARGTTAPPPDLLLVLAAATLAVLEKGTAAAAGVLADSSSSGKKKVN